NHFDRRMGDHGYLLLRYADDIVIFCKFVSDAQDALKRAKEILEGELIVAEIYTKRGGNPDLAKYWHPNMAWEHGLIQDDDVQWWLDIFAKDGKPEGQRKPSDIYTNEFNPYFKTPVK
ncbi:MAG: hypothetical protein J5U17_02770, partial [Candidatus Methanoperedens sp.]|nr:hypothetical protein [Candidatus Methanoperedens sp.]